MECPLTFYGRIPSKKNSKAIRVIHGRPIPFTSKNYAQWHRDQMKYIGQSNFVTHFRIKKVLLTFYAPDARKTDLTNKAESIMDLMVDAQIIEDDNWEKIPHLELVFGGIDRKNPRCEVIIHK